MDPKAEVERLLKEHGAKLDRKRKHCVWKFPDGRIWVCAATPSDKRAMDNQLCDLRKLLGVTPEIHKNPRRRRKPGIVHPIVFTPIPRRATWKEKLAAVELFHPQPACLAIDKRVVPMTPLWCILRNLIGYGGGPCA